MKMKEKVRSIDVRGLKVETKHSEATESLQHQIVLPFQTNQVPWFALDIGGSLIKIVYFESDREEHRIDHNFKYNEDNIEKEGNTNAEETIAIYNLNCEQRESNSSFVKKNSQEARKTTEAEDPKVSYEDSILQKHDIQESGTSDIGSMKGQTLQTINEEVGNPQTPETHQYRKSSQRIVSNKHKISPISSLHRSTHNWMICARVVRKQFCDQTNIGTITLNDGNQDINMVIFSEQLETCFERVKAGKEYFITKADLHDKAYKPKWQQNNNNTILYATSETTIKRAYDYHVPFPNVQTMTLNTIQKQFKKQKSELKNVNIIGVITLVDETIVLENGMKTKKLHLRDYSSGSQSNSIAITLWTNHVDEFDADIGDVVLVLDITISQYYSTNTGPTSRIFYNPDIPATSALRSRFFKEKVQEINSAGLLTVQEETSSTDEDVFAPPKSPIFIMKPNELTDKFTHKARVRSSSMSALTASDKQPTKLGGRLCFINFRTRDIDECLKFLQQFKNRAITRIHCTGGGSVKYKKRISKELGVEVQKMDEMYALIHGLNFLLKHIEDETYVFRGYNAETREINRGFISYKHRWNDIYPYLLVNIGSGVSIIKVTGDNCYERVSGSSLGGGTFWGLCSMLTNYKSFNEMMESTLKGDNTKVDVTVGDIYGSGYLNLHPDIIASSMAKPISLKTPRVPFEDADICKSALLMVCYNIAQIAFLTSQLHSLNRVYFAGYFIRDHPISMGAISKTLQFWSKGATRALFLKHEGYLGALGSFFQEFATPNSSGTPTSPSSSNGSPSSTLKEDETASPTNHKKSPLSQEKERIFQKPTPSTLFDED